MSRTRREDPVGKYLGESAAGDALSILGLAPVECTAQRIDAALQIQLDRVAQHVEGDTPEADEVRLALHAAAARLLDPGSRQEAIREHLDRASREGENESVSVEQRDTPTEFASATAPMADRSDRVAARAAMREEFGHAGGGDPDGPVRKLLIIGGVAVGLMVCTFLVLGVFLSSRTPAPAPVPAGSGTPTTGVTPPPPQIPENPVASEAVKATIKDGKSEYTDGATMVRALREAASAARVSPAQGVEAFKVAVRPVADWWPRMEPGQRRAADAAIIEFMYVVGNDADAAQNAARTIGAFAIKPLTEDRMMRSDEVWPAAWAIGVLSRVSAERELARPASAALAGAMNEAMGAGRTGVTLTFEDGATAALRRMPLRLVHQGAVEPAAVARSSGQGFKNWADAVQLVADGPDGVERLYIDALEQVLVAGPEPQTDPAAYEAVEILVTRLRWREQGAARQRLLDWFADVRISMGDVTVLTAVLAGKSNAEGVKPTMVLAASATPDDRAKLMNEFAQAWGIARTEARAQALVRWRGAAGYASKLAASPVVFSDDVEGMRRVVEAVKLNEAARRLWLSDAAGAERIMDDITTIWTLMTPMIGPMSGGSGGSPPASVPAQPSGKLGLQPGGASVADSGTGTWAEEYLRAERNIPLRMQKLQEAATRLMSPISRLDAGVLVDTACYGSPIAVRYEAQKLVMKFADDASVVLACLDRLPDAPKVRSIADMFDRVALASGLPKVGDPDWEPAVRRALVDRALAQLAALSPQASIDQGTVLLSESYVKMAGIESLALPDAPSDRASRGAGELFKMWRLEADRLPPAENPPLTLEQIDRRHASRGTIASGPIQVFAASQQSAAEMLAYVICAERPVQANGAKVILDDLTRARRASDHVFKQILATEWAISRLWLLRFGEGGA